VLHEAVVLDKREYLKLCEVFGTDWNKGDYNGVTALMKAVALNRVFYVEKLIKLGVDRSKRDNRGMSAMDYGLLYESFDSIDLLKEEDEN
jgi:ankyrin repeat protein